MKADTYQAILIISGVLVTALFGVFLYREIYPEYKIYQNDYIALEEFRSSYTHQSPPSFQVGVKQIVLERDDKGPPVIDRCTSCHVALQIPYFSPTKIAYDLNGNIVKDGDGHPLLVPNEEYIWLKLDEKIAELKDEKVLEQLKSQGDTAGFKSRLALAEQYTSLKTASVGDHVYDVTKVLTMHPLMGNETRPFEFHSPDEIGCTACHNGNGRGLVTDKAHGPVFDGEYEIEYEGPTPQFTESDPANDPRFAHIFNDKPGHELLFQTQPIFVGPLIQAKCMVCHQIGSLQLEGASRVTGELAEGRENEVKGLLSAYENDKQSLLDLLQIRKMIQEKGYQKTLQELKLKQSDYSQPALVQKHIGAQIAYLEKGADAKGALKKIDADLQRLLGSPSLTESLVKSYDEKGASVVDPFLKEQQKNPQVTGNFFVKAVKLNLDQDLLQHAEETKNSFASALNDQKNISALSSDVDELTQDYQRGRTLFISQACYACHRIAGFSRGGVGPELTRIGESYPWYIKQSIVWPQADLKTSTMPNMRMDHVELQDLMTFLLAQRGDNKAVAQTAYKADLQAWEGGKKLPWEKPIPPADMENTRYAMTIFATQGCASCHRLQGFDSNVGFSAEKDKKSFDEIYDQQRWFKKLFPEVIHISQYDEELPGSEIVSNIEKHAADIDARIVNGVRENGILEEIDKNYPEAIEALYSPFRFASRAKNHFYDELIKNEKDPKKIAQFKSEHQGWQERVHRVLMMYIQTYGLGRLIGPHLNWSGIYRTDEWLMEHFHNPAAHVPRSLMPILPFDDTKFYALTNMLDKLAVKNRHAVREVWDKKGFNPSEAFTMHCAQCHGTERQGNGAIAEWIYPIPKNLLNPDFLRNLTKEEAIISITHGVKGTPMPPWGEFAKDKPADVQKISDHIPVLNAAEIRYLVDWLYSSLPGSEMMKERGGVPKWKYGPQDVLEELRKEGGTLHSHPESDKSPLSYLPTGKGYYASLKPVVYAAPISNEDEIFDKVPNSIGPEPYFYYIKKKYYTPANIEAGQKFFHINCAACHGNEADGSGNRAEAMQDAKPRMLTNLDWIRSRDDLRLLRSIKFGVQGTAMTPWGDFTSSLQRLQLVIYIRTLSEERDRRETLDQLLYQIFDTAQVKVEEARVGISEALLKLGKEQYAIEEELSSTARLVAEGKKSPEEAAKIYEKKLALEKEKRAVEKRDQTLLQIKSEIKRERDLYFNIGFSLIAKDVSDEILQKFFSLIELNKDRYSIDNQKLVIHHEDKTDEKIRATRKEIEIAMQQKIDSLEKERESLLGKIQSAQRTEELKENLADIDSYKKLKAKLITDTEEALRSVQVQMQLVKDESGLSGQSGQ